MELGSTFINLNPGSPDHLWIVISPEMEDGSNIIVNLSDAENSFDDTCLVEAGEHPFVRMRSAVMYNLSRIFTLVVQETMSRNNWLQPQENVSAALLKKIQDGAFKSEYTPQKVQKLLQDALS